MTTAIRTLTARQTAVLMRLLRVAYPHPGFPDAPYERIVKLLSEAEAAVEGEEDVITAGLDALDAAAGGDFCALDDEAATAAVAAIADGPFFARVHGTFVVSFYDDHEVWDLLGYEGPSFDKGGYLHRGFDDLDWLPRPRIEEYHGPPRPELNTEGDRS
jgi:hypothetical protein